MIDGKYNKDFEIPIMDIDEEQLEIPDAEWEVDIKMNSKDFGELIKQLSTWGDDLNVKCSEDISGLKFQSSGDNGKMTVDVKDEDINLMEMVEDCKLDLNYSLSFMEMFSLFSKLGESLIITPSGNSGARHSSGALQYVSGPVAGDSDAVWLAGQGSHI